MPNPSNPSIAQSFKAGDKLAGCHILKENLPPQGNCVVWLAHDEELNKDIALHFVPDSVVADTRAMAELKQEARRNRQLVHPRIVRVHDLVGDEKWAAISMDYVQGETLAALQKKHEKNAFNPSEIALGISELCQTLEDAHRIELFHGDLTPENLLATASGLMVQKFGLSRVILDSLARGGQPADASRGLAYVSPQQLDGGRLGRGDDIYSLGASLYDLLTGAPPFAEGDPGPQIRNTVPALVSERRAAKDIVGEPIPKAWDDTIAACLAKKPGERPQSAAEAGRRFLAGKAGTPVSPVAAPAEAGSTVAAKPAAGVEPPPSAEAKVQPAAKSDSAPAEPETTAKQQKRPWASGPGKTPVIAEVTVLSKTPVPKGESKGDVLRESTPAKPGEPAAAGGAKKGGPGGPTTPTGFPLRAFVGVEGDLKKPTGKSSSGLVIAGVAVLAIIVIVGYLVARNSGGSASPAAESSLASTSGSSEAQAASPGSSITPAPAETATPAPSPVNVAANETPAPAEAAASVSPVVAESPAPGSAVAAGPAPVTDAQANQIIAEKTKAIEQVKAALATAENAAREKADAQAQAAATAQQLQAEIKQKTDDAAAAKKAADDAAATLKQQQDSLEKAEADAAEAQKVAAAKAQAAEQIRKAVQDTQMTAQQQQAAQHQAETDASDLAKAAADRQKAADDAAKVAADAEKARAQQAQALAQAQTDLGQTQAALQKIRQSKAAEEARKAADEAAHIRKEREAETARLAAQAAAATKAAEDAQKALDAAKKAVADAEKAQLAAEQQAEAARNAAVTAASPVPSIEATPAPAPSAAASPMGAGPTLSIHATNPHSKVDQALVNSLGMRFAPVGKVFFCLWITRVQDFEAFANATGFKGDAWRNPGFKQAPDHPVVNVSWNDANQFCLWLTGKEHREGILAANETYRLPTDIEWSNAVGLPPESGRTPESRDMDIPDVYPWGTQWPPPPGAGNYTGEETESDVAIKGYNDGFAWTSPVGSFNANKYGLYDMGGNVWEWCLDWWNSEQKAKVLRGGSWYNGALKLSLLSSCRIHAGADERTDNYGFRVVIAQEMSKEKSSKRHSQ